MMKSTTKIVRNIGIGLAAGTAVVAIGSQMGNHKKPMKNLKKAAGKAMNTVTAVMSDVGQMLK